MRGPKRGQPQEGGDGGVVAAVVADPVPAPVPVKEEEEKGPPLTDLDKEYKPTKCVAAALTVRAQAVRQLFGHDLHQRVRRQRTLCSVGANSVCRTLFIKLLLELLEQPNSPHTHHQHPSSVRTHGWPHVLCAAQRARPLLPLPTRAGRW